MSIEKFKEIMGAAVENVQAVAPGLSFDAIMKDVGKELQQQAAHGAHELAAAVFNGSAFVMYPRQGKEDPQHRLGNETQAQPQQEQEQSRGGVGW